MIGPKDFLFFCQLLDKGRLFQEKRATHWIRNPNRQVQSELQALLGQQHNRHSVCGRCIDEPGLCDECGYFFAAEYTLLFKGNLKITFEALRTYMKYL